MPRRTVEKELADLAALARNKADPDAQPKLAAALGSKVSFVVARAAEIVGDFELTALVPDYLDEVPIDYFDGRALRLKHAAEGLLVYSVGEDGADDGGDSITKKDRRPADLGFFLRDPEHRHVRIIEDGEEEPLDASSSD